jgi:hypothetical protein
MATDDAQGQSDTGVEPGNSDCAGRSDVRLQSASKDSISEERLDKVAEAVFLLKLLEASDFFESLPTKNWEMAPADEQSQLLDRLFIG